ncbi:hypothetical protein ACWFMI_23885 [Nocardiopsis terrae]|uniref:hypothetical protein n=1 Tax=Streptomyces sp. NPDC057554 TaxID=3350538 RepID=UPI0036BAFAB1
MIERRLTELLQTPTSERPDLPVFSAALVSELVTQGWLPPEGRKTPWAPDTSKPPASPGQVHGYSRLARRGIEAARRPTNPPHEETL